MAKETERPIGRELRSPRAAAITGILYSILTVAIMLLTFGLTRADPADADSALQRLSFAIARQ